MDVSKYYDLYLKSKQGKKMAILSVKTDEIPQKEDEIHFKPSNIYVDFYEENFSFNFKENEELCSEKDFLYENLSKFMESNFIQKVYIVRKREHKLFANTNPKNLETKTIIEAEEI